MNPEAVPVEALDPVFGVRTAELLLFGFGALVSLVVVVVVVLLVRSARREERAQVAMLQSRGERGSDE